VVQTGRKSEVEGKSGVKMRSAFGRPGGAALSQPRAGRPTVCCLESQRHDVLWPSYSHEKPFLYS
jgi:hypothetical protein